MELDMYLKYQLSNTYDEEFGYKSKEEECIIF